MGNNLHLIQTADAVKRFSEGVKALAAVRQDRNSESIAEAAAKLAARTAMVLNVADRISWLELKGDSQLLLDEAKHITVLECLSQVETENEKSYAVAKEALKEAVGAAGAAAAAMLEIATEKQIGKSTVA